MAGQQTCIAVCSCLEMLSYCTDSRRVSNSKVRRKAPYPQTTAVTTRQKATKDQRRMISFNVLIAGTGDCLSRIAKISDFSFTECKKAPLLFEFGTGDSKLFVIMVHPTLPDGII